MNRKVIDQIEKLIGQLESLHEEMSALSKKSPNDAVNEFKIKFVNSILEQGNKILGSRYKPFGEFESFSTEDLPTNSDITFMISQYLQSVEKLRADNIYLIRFGEWAWNLEDGDGKEQVRTSPPRKLFNK